MRHVEGWALPINLLFLFPGAALAAAGPAALSIAAATEMPRMT
jgi:hypothetical protein